jgi:hypothetical protein
LDPTDPRFAEINIEACETFSARLEELHGELIGAIWEIKIAEIGGIRSCRDEDSDRPCGVLAVHLDDTTIDWEHCAVGNGVVVTIAKGRLIVLHERSSWSWVLKLEMSACDRHKTRNYCSSDETHLNFLKF